MLYEEGSQSSDTWLCYREKCDLCQLMADEPAGFGPAFWHLDGCNIDEGFAFSSYRTLAEYEEEECRRRQFGDEFDRKWEAGEFD